MRRAMICVSFMLAIVQMWPLLFGGNAANPGAATQFVPAAKAALRPVSLTVPTHARPSKGAIPTCYHRYERAYAGCQIGDAACQLRAGDNWDVCEATGFWPE